MLTFINSNISYIYVFLSYILIEKSWS